MTNSNQLPLVDASASIAEMEREFNLLQRQIRLAIEDRLAKFAGQSIGDLAENQQWVTLIHQLLDRHGLRIRCNECGHPAILRVSPRTGAPNGVFVFDHTVNGRRTFHGGRNVMPAIVLVAKPPRKKKVAAGQIASSRKDSADKTARRSSGDTTDRAAG